MPRKAKQAVCDRGCFQCVHSDCILDAGPNLEEYRLSAELDRIAWMASCPLADESMKRRAWRRARKKYEREDHAAWQKAWRESNREADAARRRAHRAANRDAFNAYQRAYRAANRDACNAYQQAYRARKKAERG